MIGRAIDRGVADKDGQALLTYAAVMFGIGLVQAVSGIMRHRFAVTNWLTAAYRVVQLTGRHAVHLGGTLPRKVSTGEVVAIGTNDISHIGGSMDVTARFSGAIVSFVVVAVILLQTSTTLGLLVLIGVPALVLLIGPLLKPLDRRAAHQRQLMGELSNTATDIVGGLRVLRGIGGEQVFHDRYRRESQTTRQAGVAVARLQSVLDALQVFLPGLFVVVVVWVGARYAAQGTITPGELVAFYGYSAFLMIPLRTATEFANKLIRARVAAARVCRVLAGSRPTGPTPLHPARPAAARLRPGRPAHRPAGARRCCSPPWSATSPTRPCALADRLGLHAPPVEGQVDDDVRLGGVPLTSLRRDDVRRLVVVSDTGVDAVLRPARRRPRRDRRGSGAVERALATTSSGDILDALPRRSRHRGRRAAAAPSPAASGSGSCWPACSPATPRCWSWSSRRRPSTRTPSPGSPAGCARSAPAGPPSS